MPVLESQVSILETDKSTVIRVPKQHALLNNVRDPSSFAKLRGLLVGDPRFAGMSAVEAEDTAKELWAENIQKKFKQVMQRHRTTTS